MSTANTDETTDTTSYDNELDQHELGIRPQILSRPQSTSSLPPILTAFGQRDEPDHDPAMRRSNFERLPERHVDDSASNWLDSPTIAGSSDPSPMDSPGANAVPSRYRNQFSPDVYEKRFGPTENISHQYPPQQQQWRTKNTSKPLISYVTNEWQHKPARKRTRSESPWRSAPPDWPSFLVWRMCRASTFGWILLVVLLYMMVWWMRDGPRFEAKSILHQSAKMRYAGKRPVGRARGWFGDHVRVSLSGISQMGTLPEAWKWEESRRLVVVGDVHGCVEDLHALLSHISFAPTTDTLVLAGDLVAKGPSSSAVLDLAASLSALCVRGNHDDRVLLAHRDLSSPLRVFHSDSGSHRPLADSTRQRASELAVASSLSAANLAYLRSCPAILDLGAIPGLAPRAAVVHAGLVPGLALDRQDPTAVMNMRSLDLRAYYPSADHAPGTLRVMQADGRIRDNSTNKAVARMGRLNMMELEKQIIPWNEAWEEYQKVSKEEERMLVVYGHDSPRGLIDGDWAVGLDTGCVNGGQLSALVLEMRGGKVVRRVESVKCKGREKKAEKGTVAAKDN